MKLIATNSRPLCVTFRRPITVMDKNEKATERAGNCCWTWKSYDCVYEL